MRPVYFTYQRQGLLSIVSTKIERVQKKMSDKFTNEDITSCWDYHLEYLVDILNGDYSLEDARKDLCSLVGSEYDRRTDIDTHSLKLSEEVRNNHDH